jgi:hypothetical protein
VTKDWILKTPAVIDLSGTVKVVSAEDQWRFIVFELAITPQVNLSNQTIMYIVLTEDIATDHHRRQTTSLVRELRPEVGFSLKANNTTEMTTMLSADHLDAAGVNLEAGPTPLQLWAVSRRGLRPETCWCFAVANSPHQHNH